MNVTSYAITGGDFDLAGLASSGLKQRLKKLGVAPACLRRVLIAAYEAEANIVVHAHKGTLRAALGPSRIDVEVADEGPGIPDIEQAMKEGFSTASPAAMALGFGAGMGLPSIRKNSDSFAIESEVGRGTRVSFSIRLSRQEASGPLRNSLHVVRTLCRKGMRCVRVCPTKALRIRRGGPEILEHLCIDCAACIEACQTGALSAPAGVDLPTRSEDTFLVVPASFLVAFGPRTSARHVLEALSATGFRHVRVVEEWEVALRGATLEYARERAMKGPVFSPVCPAVVNLVETRFPSLIPHLAPFLSPVEAVREELECEHLVVGVSCPAQYTALSTGPSSSRLAAVSLSRLREAVLPVAARADDVAEAPVRGARLEDDRDQDVLRVSGLRHVIEALDKAENGLLGDCAVVELFACDQGCFGAPVAAEDAFIAQHRWQRARSDFIGPAKAVRRKAPFLARSGMRLDKDMSRAIEKLQQIDRLIQELPGKDCGMCGAPTCAALAEDIALGRAESTACPYRADGPEADR